MVRTAMIFGLSATVVILINYGCFALPGMAVEFEPTIEKAANVRTR